MNINTLHNTTIAEIQNFQKNPTQKRFFEIMILRENFVGQVDTILREFPDSDNPFLEKFLSENPDEKERDAIIIDAAKMLSKNRPIIFEKILRNTRESENRIFIFQKLFFSIHHTWLYQGALRTTLATGSNGDEIFHC